MLLWLASCTMCMPSCPQGISAVAQEQMFHRLLYAGLCFHCGCSLHCTLAQLLVSNLIHQSGGCIELRQRCPCFHAGPSVKELCLIVHSSACLAAYQQLSYMILSRVHPVTHSIGNCVKRVVVIVASLIIFKNPISMQNAAGVAGKGMVAIGIY